MQSQFARALIGFIVLSVALFIATILAVFALEAYTPGASMAFVVVIIFAFVVEVCIYGSTLHEPVYDWIKAGKKS